ncbi:hypothetical protein [Sphaerisporangium corydalis]|uniref:DUF1049 domain-containing protein n=1 Tax=Sphaerisporangium corydalis TaxID=1441875 RepID=A0ABV9EA99_9ACTN|nr:hypothetical protein [Sphaerisporangium corydalis]
MIVLGLLLIVLAGAALVAVANDENGGITASITILDRTLQLSKLELFLAGAATAAVFLIGLLVLTGGMRRSGAKRKKLRAARVETRDRVARLEEEKRQLERKLETETAATPEPVPVAGTPTGRHATDRDGDGVDDRAETGTEERVGASTQPVAAVQEPRSTDQLVAGTRSPRDTAV